jgi:allantoicase
MTVGSPLPAASSVPRDPDDPDGYLASVPQDRAGDDDIDAASLVSEPGAEYWRSCPDLASRAFGGAVVWANDEFYAARENLITPGHPTWNPDEFTHRGKVYDGWETRRRREPGTDSVIVRIGIAGIVRGIVIDTAFFRGNYPPYASVEGTIMFNYPTAQELAEAEWRTLLPKSPLSGDTHNEFAIDGEHYVTHVRLTIYPDGGVARLRVHGDVVAEPRYLGSRFDLAALQNGGRITACSNMFYSSPTNVISPGLAAVMSNGWETARRRDDGNDWLVVALAAPGIVHDAVIDTSYFVGNAPGWATLSGADARASDLDDPSSWRELLGTTRLQPDVSQRFRVQDDSEVTHVRLDIHPDGGIARLRLNGEIAPSGRSQLVRRWLGLVPHERAVSVLSAEGVAETEIESLLAAPDDPDVIELIAAVLLS